MRVASCSPAKKSGNSRQNHFRLMSRGNLLSAMAPATSTAILRRSEAHSWRTLPELKGRKFILFLSRIHPKKGVDLLIQAFARHAKTFPEIDLVIAGPDQTGSKSALQKLARELGVDNRIYWPGMLSGDAKWGAFRSAEFFVLPSHQENFGIVVAEAMALSKPVLITNKVNIWREIEADGAGLVVNDDVEGIAAGLRKMCELSAAATRSLRPQREK